MEPYYQHQNITLYHGDCLPVLAALPTGSVDLIFTSPPYNLGNTSGGGEPAARRTSNNRGVSGNWPAKSMWDGGKLANGYEDYADNLPHAEYVTWQHEILRACWRVLAADGAIFYNHKVRSFGRRAVFPTAYVPPELLPMIRQEIIWARGGGINFSAAFYLPTHERILIIARPAWRLKSKSASGIGDVWYVPIEQQTGHPAPFPLALPARAIETTGAQTVLDPFSGRGTTVRAAKNAGINGIGIDRHQGYCDLAVSWLRQETIFPPDPTATQPPLLIGAA